MKQRHLFLLVLAFTATTALAGWRDDAPSIKDPYEGLLPAAVLKEGDKGPILNPSTKRLAIIMSGNSNEHLKWSEEVAAAGVAGADRFFGTIFAGADRIAERDQVIAQGYRSQFITAALLRPLLDTFKEVKLMNDFAEFRDSGFDLAVLLDITFVNTFFDSPVFIGNKYETATAVKAQFITSGFQAGPSVEVARKREIPRNGFAEGVMATRKAVFADYQANIQKLVGTGRPKEAVGGAVGAPPASTADRLRELDQLRRDGLVTEAEASAKRQQILQGL